VGGGCECGCEWWLCEWDREWWLWMMTMVNVIVNDDGERG
jgi:hypothetical protein